MRHLGGFAAGLAILIASTPLAAQEAVAPAPGEFGRAAKLEVQPFDNKQVRFEYPKKDWEIVPRASAAVVLAVVSLLMRRIVGDRKTDRMCDEGWWSM